MPKNDNSHPLHSKQSAGKKLTDAAIKGASVVDSSDLQQTVAELTEALQRERADAVNLRRRHDEQIASLRTTIKAHVVKDLLPVIDNLERALKHAPQKPSLESRVSSLEEYVIQLETYAVGVQKVFDLFEKTLADMGVERIATVGEHFNPHLHEAVSMEEGDGEHEVVSEELQSGYKIGDEVIRHAMVRVRSE